MLKFQSFFLVSVFVVTLNAQEVFDGYTLYAPSGGAGGNSGTTYLKDASGNDIHTWSHDCGPASMPYLIPGEESGLENSLLYYPCKSSNPSMDTGGTGGQIKIYNWDGDLLWDYEVSGTVDGTTSSNSMQHHHDIQPLPNGNILIIAWERLHSSEWESLGVNGVDNSLNQVWMTVVLEVEPNFNTGGAEIVWEWYIKDHLIQNYNSNYDNYGTISQHPELMDANCGTIGSSGGPGGEPNGDWMHINAIDYNEELNQIVLSSRFQDEIYIIDHSTTTEEAASHSGGNSGKGGDFLYRWGNPQNYDRGNNSDHWLGDQHSINWIDNEYPGEGNLICFVNQYSGMNASILEFVPPLLEDGSYYIEDGDPYGPSSYEWIEHATNNFNFSTAMQGGAFRLPNGNTLITDCDNAYIYEISENGNMEFDWTAGGNNVIARAQKYPPEYFDFISGTPGDVNDDGVINVLDVVQTINMILGIQETNYLADLNDDDIVNILDIVLMINIVINP